LRRRQEETEEILVSQKTRAECFKEAAVKRFLKSNTRSWGSVLWEVDFIAKQIKHRRCMLERIRGAGQSCSLAEAGACIFHDPSEAANLSGSKTEFVI
jgi:hypothetical protein